MKMLEHETQMAADERRAARKADADRRVMLAADQLIAALGDFVTVRRDTPDAAENFVRISTTADVHRERGERVGRLFQSGASHSHVLPLEARERWDGLMWLVRFNQTSQPERGEDLRRRDAIDLQNYVDYVRRTLSALSMDEPLPKHFAVPDVRREDRRPWGFKPDSGTAEQVWT